MSARCLARAAVHRGEPLALAVPQQGEGLQQSLPSAPWFPLLGPGGKPPFAAGPEPQCPGAASAPWVQAEQAHSSCNEGGAVAAGQGGQG
eukprot:1695323-Lingulodinium_polyedra.AAC.1